MATKIQLRVTASVIAHWRSKRRHYRAASNGERVTLASLHRAGVLARQCWRGRDGEADAAYEYRPSNVLLAEIARASGDSPVAAMSPVDETCAEYAAAGKEGR